MKKILMLIMTLLIGTMAFATKMEDYANPNALLSPKQAKEIIENGKDVVVLDVRKTTAFATGHIPSALDIWRPAMEADKGEYDFGGMRASKEKMEETLSQYGITKDTHILIYDAKADYDATRLWWVLDMYGHEKISLIDGGIHGWKEAGLSVEMGTSKKPNKSNYKFTEKTDNSKLAYLSDVKAVVDGKETGIIIDTRSDKEHNGSTTKKGAFRPGRIPSEVFIKWETTVNWDGDRTFKSAEELEKIYGDYKNENIIAYCQSGVRSAHTAFVLTQLLGYENVKNYDGSWIEWSYNKELQADKD